MNDSLWYKNAIFYQVYIRAFADSNGDGYGDLRGLTAKLDYLCDLGVDCLWLMPMYPSPLIDDGYDIADYTNIHPDYGTLDDFKTFLAEAHRRGLRVITDLVLNHTSDQHPWFKASRSSKDSPYRDYYIWSDTDRKFKEARIIFLDTQKSNWEFDPTTGQYFFHRFYPQQPDLNYDNPAVRQAMIEVMKFWLDLGLDGFRADAVPYLIKREGTNCENLPETHAYLKELRRFMDEHYLDRILLAEANQWPEDVRAYFGAGDEFQMGFHFPIMPRIFMALRRNDRASLQWIMDRTPPIPDNCQWCIFLRNHDELTLEMVTEEERQWMWREYAPDPRMRLNLGIRRRLAPLLDHDRQQIELANSLLFTLPGSPSIYYGDEIGMGDNISLPDRNGVRTPMQWDASRNAGFSSAPADQLYAPVIDDSARVNAAYQRADPNSLFNTLRRMIALRKKHSAFGQGRFEWAACNSNAVAAYVRQHHAERLLILNNLSRAAQQVEVQIPDGASSSPVDLLTGKVFPTSSDGQLKLSLAPHQYLWLALSETQPASKP
jgi:maltose alpha-D-glucosyltransferase/alpha-amylase